MKLEINSQEAVKSAEKKLITLADNSRITIISQATFDQARLQLVQVKAVKKFITEKKLSITKPLNEALKNVRVLFKPAEEKIVTIESYLNGEVLKYNHKLIAERKKREEEAMEKVREEQRKKQKAQEESDRLEKERKEKEEAGQKISEEEEKKINNVKREADKDIDVEKITKKLDKTSENIDKIKTRKIKKMIITDIKLIPREYLLPNEQVIKTDLLAGNIIPGAKIIEEEIAVNLY